MEGFVGAGDEFGLIAGGGFAGLGHHRRVDEEGAAVDKRAGGGNLTAAGTEAAAFATGKTEIYGEVAAEGFAFAVVPGERAAEKSEKSLAEAGDRLALRLAGETRAGDLREGTLDARGDEQERFALDSREEFGLVLGFAGNTRALIGERVGLDEARGALLVEHKPDHRTGDEACARRQGLGFVGRQHYPVFIPERDGAWLVTRSSRFVKDFLPERREGRGVRTLGKIPTRETQAWGPARGQSVTP